MFPTAASLAETLLDALADLIVLDEAPRVERREAALDSFHKSRLIGQNLRNNLLHEFCRFLPGACRPPGDFGFNFW